MISREKKWCVLRFNITEQFFPVKCEKRDESNSNRLESVCTSFLTIYRISYGSLLCIKSSQNQGKIAQKYKFTVFWCFAICWFRIKLQFFVSIYVMHFFSLRFDPIVFLNSSIQSTHTTIFFHCMPPWTHLPEMWNSCIFGSW